MALLLCCIRDVLEIRQTRAVTDAFTSPYRKFHHVRKHLLSLTGQFSSMEQEVTLLMQRVYKVSKQEVLCV